MASRSATPGPVNAGASLLPQHPVRDSRTRRVPQERRTTFALALATVAALAPVPDAQAGVPADKRQIRSMDGGGNNLKHPDWGRAGSAYRRVAEPNYADGIQEARGGPPVRYISNRIFDDGAQNLFSENGVTHWGFAWGQFIDHGFGLRIQAGGETSRVGFDVKDPLEGFHSSFDYLDFSRTPAAPGTGKLSPRQQINTISSYISGWNVYGGTDERLEWLREGPVDGDLSNNRARLLMTRDDHLPRADARGDAARAPWMDPIGRLAAAPAKVAVAGDVRANENIALTSLHTLFAREHNRIVDKLPRSLSQEDKFQIARRVVGAQQQYVTYNEFLPALGVTLRPYRGYRTDVDSTLTNEFAVAGYRAHSMVHGEFEPAAPAWRYSSEQLARLRAKDVEVGVEGDELSFVIPLNVAFGDPDLVAEIGLGPILAGLGRELQYRNDEQIDNQLRSVMFQVPRPSTDPRTCLDGPTLRDCFQGVVDLAALDVERGRDHGVPYYNDLRRAYGLRPKTSFAAITGEEREEFPSDPEIDPADPLADPDILDFVELRDGDGKLLEAGTEAADSTAVTGVRRTSLAARLKAIYGGDVGHLDAFVGIVAEPHVRGTEFGELQLAIWKRQFEALRDGDRFFYGNDRELKRVVDKYDLAYDHTLAEIITKNTELDPGDIQQHVFEAAPSEGR
jgi:Animal haem peroxidase